MGALFEPTDRLRFGMSFRPKTTFNNKGYLNISQTAAQRNYINSLGTVAGLAGVAISDLNSKQLVKQDITLPSELNTSVFYQATPKIDLLASFVRQDFNPTKLKYQRAEGSGNVVEDIPTNYKVTRRYAVGMNYHAYRRLTLRAGVAKENSAVPDATRVTALPDSDRTYYAVGAGLA